MKSIIVVLALVLTATAQARHPVECAIQARISEDIANMLDQGISPDKINFVNPANPTNDQAQKNGNELISEVQRLQGLGYTPKQIKEEVMQMCMNPGDIKT